jgi:hypothetical protein
MKTKNLLKIYFIRKPNLNSVVVTGSGLYEKQGKENKGLHSCSPSNTYCIHSCENLREQISLFGEADAAMSIVAHQASFRSMRNEEERQKARPVRLVRK